MSKKHSKNDGARLLMTRLSDSEVYSILEEYLGFTWDNDDKEWINLEDTGYPDEYPTFDASDIFA